MFPKHPRLNLLIVRLTILLFMGLVATVAVNSQADKPPREIVLTALESLNGTDYRYTVETTSRQTSSEPNGEMLIIDMIIQIEAEIAANGNYHVVRTQAEAPSEDGSLRVSSGETITLEWWQIGDERYHWIDEGLAELMNMSSGLWLESELVATYEDNIAIQYSYLSLTQQRHPHMILPDYPALIQQISELDSEVIDGRVLRVFDIEVDSRLVWLLEQTDGSLTALAELMLTPPDYQFGYDLRLRAWVGADDARLYRLGLDEVVETTLPYVNLSYINSSVYDLAYPDEPIVIEVTR